MIVVTGTARECEILRRLIAGTIHRLGVDAPDELRSTTFAVIERHPPSTDATPEALAAGLLHDRHVTYTEAARAAHVSLSTIGRRVADGTLDRVGRRVTAASLRRWLGGQENGERS